MIQSSAGREPRRYSNVSGGMPPSVRDSLTLQGLFVRAELHFGHALGVGNTFAFDEFERPRVERFILDVQARQLFPGNGEGGEAGREWDAREFAFEIRRVTFAVHRVVQQRVEVVEDGFFCDRVVGIVLEEFGEGGVFEVGEGKALPLPASGRFIGDRVSYLNREWYLAMRCDTD